jgi:hypothetical protein
MVSSPKPPPGRVDVGKEKPPSEPKAKSKHQVSDEKLMARGRNYIIHSKRVDTFATTKAAPKAAPKDVDAAGDVARSDDSDTSNSNKSGSGSDTPDADGHHVTPQEENMKDSDAELATDKPAIFNADKLEATDDPESARRDYFRENAKLETQTPSLLPTNDKPAIFNTDKLEALDTPELKHLRLQPRRCPTRNSHKIPTCAQSSSSVADKDLDTKGTLSVTLNSVTVSQFTFQIHIPMSCIISVGAGPFLNLNSVVV